MKISSKAPIMKSALVALVTATIGFAAIAPTFAQEAAATAPAAQTHQQSNNSRHNNQGPRQGGRMGGGDFLSFERGADAIKIALVRLSQRVDLTAAQQPLFDTFKTEALSAATDFATKTEGLRPTPPAEGETPAAPNLADRLDKEIALQTARLDALKAVQPAATAFFDSLTTDQLASLTPQRPDRDGGMQGGFGKHGPRHQGPGGHEGGKRGGPGAPAGAPGEAPADAPAAPPVNG